MVTVRIEHRSTREGDADAWIEAIRGPREAMDAVAEVVANDVSERFNTETSPWGDPWPALRPATIAIYERRQKAGGRRRLERSRFARVVDGGRRAVIGLRSKVARWFQFGNPANRMFGRPAPRPPREVLPVREDGSHDLPGPLRAEVMEAFREGFRRAIRRG